MGVDNRFRRIRPVIEAGVLAAPALAFLHRYSAHVEPGNGATQAHLLLLAWVWAGVIALRLAAWRLAPRAIARPLVTFCCAATWSLLPLYYLVATIGLEGWGKVITWPILKPYLAAPSDLLAYVGVPVAAGIAGAGVLAALVGLFWSALVGRDDWVDRLQSKLSAAPYTIVLLVLTAFSAAGIGQYVAMPPTHVGEPVSLTFFPLPPAKLGQSAWPIDAARLLQENDARAALRNAVPARRPNVILIVSDALRADRMEVYGYPRSTTPHLAARLGDASGGERVRAIAACAETSCGMPALLYSRHPRAMVSGALGLSEALRTLGYRSHMLLSGDHTNYYGLAELYRPSDTYVDATTQGTRFVNDDAIVLDAIRALPPSRPGKQAFLQLHLLSNHPLGTRQAGSNWFEPQGNYSHWGKSKRGAALTQRERVLAGNFYDNGVRQMDAFVERILNDLAAKGYLREALVVLTSDHGEALGEHDVLSHTASVFQPVLDIPAVFIRYGYRGTRFPPRQWASQLDIAPTIFAELGLRPPATWAGLALQSAETRDLIAFEQDDEVGFVRMQPPYAGHKFWIDRKRQREFFFDLRNDPGEQANLAATLAGDVRRAWRARALQSVVGHRTGDASPAMGAGGM